MKFILLTPSLLAAAALCSPGATFYTISDIDVNMTSGNPGGNPLSNIIEGPGVGFDAAEPHNQTGGVWYTDAPGGFPSDYIAANAGPEYIWLDLGSDVRLTEISYWGYSTANANGMKDFNVSFATDAEGGAPGLGDELYGTSIVSNPAFTALLDNAPRQSFSFAPVDARYVRVEATSTYFSNNGQGPPPGGDRLGIGEIAFAVPEPSAAILAMLGSFLLFRRRR